MDWRNRAGRAACGAAVAAMIVAASGCSSAFREQRRKDLLQIGDWGVTVSKKPYLSMHVCGFGIVSAGGGHVEGKFFGYGGEQIGTIDHYHKCLGLIAWSYDEIGWGDKLDPQDPTTFMQWHIGPIGWLGYPRRAPAYTLACTHYLHLGFIGLMANARYFEMLDFATGFVGYDLQKDDERALGDWSYQTANPKFKPKWCPKLPF